ncbi:MAG: phosphoribosylglycinamide formyltransferase [Bacteroidetes bacterium]|nr:phosphoribosylglycinamide formyltransferase [Bacteroidota bacterium]
MSFNKGFYNIAIMASGRGSNARAIIDYFKNHQQIEVRLLLSNRQDSGIPVMSYDTKISHNVFTRKEYHDEMYFLEMLRQYQIDFIVLAGFLWLIPEYLVRHYHDRILNIHPALLPSYGGKGMYGDNIHKAVLNSGDKESGVTVHLVNENYDDGKIIHQGIVDIKTCSTADQIAKKVLAMEHVIYPKAIEKYILEHGDEE